MLFWAEVLADDRSNYLQQQQKYPYLQFGNLIEFRFEFGVLDSAWLKKESAEKMNSRNQGNRLF